MNRRRPWHQRIVRKVTRHVPLKSVMVGSPLGIFFIFNVLSFLVATLFGYMAIAAVLAAAAVGCLACHIRRHSNLTI